MFESNDARYRMTAKRKASPRQISCNVLAGCKSDTAVQENYNKNSQMMVLIPHEGEA
jgi:hypothetical protein